MNQELEKNNKDVLNSWIGEKIRTEVLNSKYGFSSYFFYEYKQYNTDYTANKITLK